MKFLLDVNALIALKHTRSPHHQFCRRWVAKEGIDSLATCALTELGFIRVSMAAFGVTLADAQQDLADLKRKIPGFVEDRQKGSNLKDRQKGSNLNVCGMLSSATR